MDVVIRRTFLHVVEEDSDALWDIMSAPCRLETVDLVGAAASLDAPAQLEATEALAFGQSYDPLQCSCVVRS